MEMGEGGIGRPNIKCAHVMRMHSSADGLCPSSRGRSIFVGGFNKGELDSFLVDACRVNGFSFLELQDQNSMKVGYEFERKTYGTNSHT